MPEGTTTLLQQQIERLRAGHAAARDELISRACDRLRRLTHTVFRDFRRVHQFEDTDDVLHNAVPRLLRRLEAETPASVGQFFQLAAREIRCALLDLARHYYGPRGAGRHEFAPPPPDGSPSTPPQPDGADLSHDPAGLAVWTEFHETVEALPAEERMLFDLLWYDGLTLPEAAEILGWSLSKLKRHWLEARLRVRELLFDQEAED